MANATSTVEKPQPGQSVPVTLTEGQATIACQSGDIKGMELTEGGKLLMTFTDGGSVTINNFQELSSQGSIFKFADGTTVNTVELLSSLSLKSAPANDGANDSAEVLVGQPAAGQTVEIELEPGMKYNFAFNEETKEDVSQEAGALIITFDDGGKLVLKNFSEAMDATDPVQVSVGGDVITLGEFANYLKLADAMNDKMDDEDKPAMAEIREDAGEVIKVEPASGKAKVEGEETSMRDVREDMNALAEQLAGVEPAAGGQAGGGSSRGGFGFQSVPDAANINPLSAIGPIGPTALQFGLPQPQDPIYIEEEDESEPVAPPTVLANLGVDNAIVKEDGAVFVPLSAAIGSGGDGDEVLTLTVTGIDPTWGLTFTDGSYNPATGTWTITMPPGQNYNGGLTFTPPAGTDGDMPGLTATVSVFDPDTGGTQIASDPFNVVTDAVADVPTIQADDNSGVKNTPLAVNITAAVTDLDGSETITHYQVMGVPAGFTFNQGTDLGAGVWQFTPAQLTGLTMTPPLHFHGSIGLSATVFSGETALSGAEVDFSDNTNSASDEFMLTWTPKITPPDLTINNQADFVNGIVKEDGSITIPVAAELAADAAPDEYLTVTVTGIPASWSPVFTGGGTYDSVSGTWTIVLPAGADFNGSITFTPPAQSDVDLSGLNGTATATQPSSGLTASDSDAFGIITDAVADQPAVNATDSIGVKNMVLPVNISGSLGVDTDGSESITHYQVSGVPAGFSFNQGTNAGAGVWTFTPTQLTGLTMTAPLNFHGTINLTATVFNGETALGGTEVDFSDNTNSASDSFALTWTPKITPPDLTINNAVDFVNGQVKEDSSVTIPVTAVLAADAEVGEYLTVTITGIPSTWGFSAPVGTYSSATGTWTITMPANTNLSTALTFTPPANSDLDLSGLSGTAVATQPSSGLTASDSDAFGIITDAVADTPTINAANGQVNEGQPIAVNVTAALTDLDGSELITGYSISGVPAGFSFNQGTNAGAGVWTFTPAQIAGLTLTPTANYNGSVNLTATVFNTENPVSDGEFDPADNNNQASDPFTLSWKPVINPPDITVNQGVDDAQVKEDGSIGVPITATLGADPAPSEYLTVTVTGIGSTWGFSAPVGTYNATTGTWTVTLAPGQNLSTVMTFTPPANSDIDLNNLNAVVVATDPVASLTASNSDAFRIVVDAVADKPTLSVAAPFIEEGNRIPITINAALTDLDGSELISHYQISGVQAGFTFNQGTDLGGGVWQFTPAQIIGLEMIPTTPTTTAHFYTQVTVFNTENPVSDSEYDLTDNNNSTTVQMKIWVKPDDTPVLVQPEKVTVDETNLAATGTTSVSDRVEANFFSDTPGSFSANGGFFAGVPLTSNGVAVVVTQTGNVYTARAGADTIFTLTLQSDGNYTFSLTGTLDHPNTADHNDNIVLQFGVRATDSDGDSVNGVITVNVLDDGVDARDDFADVLTSAGFVDGELLPNDYRGQDTPSTVTQIQSGAIVVNVPETGTVSINGQYGALTLAADGSYTYTLNGSTSGIGVNEKEFATTNTFPTLGESVALDPAGNFYGITAGDLTAADPATGTITFRSEGAGFNNTVGMFTYGPDGTISASEILIQNGNNVTFGTPFNFSVAAGQTVGFFLIADGFDTNNSYAGIDLNTGTLSLVYKNGTAQERPATINDAGADVVMVHTSTGGVETVLTEPMYFSTEKGGSTSLNEDGSVRVVSGLADPADNTVIRIGFEDLPGLGDKDFNDIVFDVTLTEDCGCAEDQFTYTLTDADGDSDKAVLTIECIDDDTNPIVVKPADKVVDETNLASGAVTTSGQFQANFFADAPGTFSNTGTVSSSVPLTSNGVAVVVSLVGGVYVGQAGAETIFTLTTQPNGQYTFNLTGTLDHPDTTNHNDAILLNFGIRATDSDGDSDTTTLTVKVLDDGVTAYDDVNTFETPSVSTTGNVVTGLNGGAGAADSLSQDDPNHVTTVSFGGTTVAIPEGGSNVINGQYGQLQMFSDGSYEYTLFPSSLVGPAVFNTVTLTDAASGTVIEVTAVQVATGVQFNVRLVSGVADLNGFFLDVNGDGGTVFSVGSSDNNMGGTMGFDYGVALGSVGGSNADVTNATFTINGLTLTSLDDAIVGVRATSVGVARQLSVKLTGDVGVVYENPDDMTDQFTYKLVDDDGDSDTATLTFNALSPDLIVGKNVDDVTGSSTTWQVGGDDGQINGGGASDVLIGDVGGSSTQNVNKDYNIVLILDVSGSMQGDKITLLKQAVNNLLGDFNNYNGGAVKVHIVPFSTGALAAQTFTVTNDTDFNNAMNFVNGMNADGFTNYEAPMQSALNWLNGATANDPIAGGQTFTYFVSDGEPNRFVNSTGGISSGSASDVMNQITGVSDASPEVSQLQAFGEVVGVGIGVNGTTLSRLSVIDSGSDSALNVQDPNDLSNALQGASPLNQLAAVGDDVLTGGNGNEYMFGDSLNTDALAVANGLSMPAGSGWAVFTALGWDESQIVAYIKANAETLATESLGSGGVGRAGGGDALYGGAGADVIFGQEGNDVIYGGAGDDTLYGGSGADDFMFDATNNGVDTIKDFTINDFSVAEGDALDLSAMLVAYNSADDDAINAFVFATEVNGNTVVSVDVTGSGNFAGAQTVAILQGVTGVTNVEDILSSNSGGNV